MDKILLLTWNELEKLVEWCRQHRETCTVHGVKVIAGCDSGIGQSVSISCGCGASEDFTDYSAW
jgi:hypothetical protein